VARRPWHQPSCPYLCLPPSFSCLLRSPPWSALFPYTTLFRSCHFPACKCFQCHAFICPAPNRMEPPFAVSFPSCSPIWKSCMWRSEEHTSELQSRFDLVCRLLLEKKNTQSMTTTAVHGQLSHS